MTESWLRPDTDNLYLWWNLLYIGTWPRVYQTDISDKFSSCFFGHEATWSSQEPV
jgi:hypothetical protein